MRGEHGQIAHVLHTVPLSGVQREVLTTPGESVQHATAVRSISQAYRQAPKLLRRALSACRVACARPEVAKHEAQHQCRGPQQGAALGPRSKRT